MKLKIVLLQRNSGEESGSISGRLRMDERILKASWQQALHFAQLSPDRVKANTNSGLCLHIRALWTSIPGPIFYNLGSEQRVAGISLAGTRGGERLC